jgi:hypothetical protein
MIKKIQFKIFAIFCFLVVINSYGQECLNQVQSSEISTFRKDESKYFYTNQYRTRTSQTIKLAPHIIRDSNGNGGLTESDLSLSIEQLNSAYQQLNIIFEACPVNYIDNDTFFSNIPYSTSEGSIEYQMAVPNRIDDAINVFFVPSAQSGAACGWSSFPSYVDLYNKDWTVMANSCVTNTSTLAHEIGHYFSLYHTHETAFGTERVTRTNTSDCNSNCSNTGDLLCDTEADPKLSNLVNSSCSYIGTSSDSCGLNHTPNPTNLMSYSRKHCRTFFFNGQINRILTSLANDRTNLVSSCTNNCPDNSKCKFRSN